MYYIGLQTGEQATETAREEQIVVFSVRNVLLCCLSVRMIKALYRKPFEIVSVESFRFGCVFGGWVSGDDTDLVAPRLQLPCSRKRQYFCPTPKFREKLMNSKKDFHKKVKSPRSFVYNITVNLRARLSAGLPPESR